MRHIVNQIQTMPNDFPRKTYCTSAIIRTDLISIVSILDYIISLKLNHTHRIHLIILLNQIKDVKNKTQKCCFLFT